MKKLLTTASVIALTAVLAACETTAPSQQPEPVDPKPPQTMNSSTAPTPTAQEQSAQAQGQQSQAVITLHLAQQQQEEGLVDVNVGDGTLYALPQPVITQAQMSGVSPVVDQGGSSHILFRMNEDGAQRLNAITEQARGHYLLLSVNGQLVSLAQITDTISDGTLLVPTQNEAHSSEIIQMMRQGPQQEGQS